MGSFDLYELKGLGKEDENPAYAAVAVWHPVS